MIKGLLLLLCSYALVIPVFSDHYADSLETKLPSSSGEERFTILTNLAKHYSRSDIQKSLAYAQASYELADQADNAVWKATSLNNLGLLHNTPGKTRKPAYSEFDIIKTQSSYRNHLKFSQNEW